MPFYYGSTRRLGPNSRCDCHRTYAKPVGSKTIENRFFWTTGLNLSFVQVLNPESILGSWTPAGEFADERHRGIHEAFAPNWRMEWTECMLKVIARLQPPPTVLVLNMGQWNGGPNASYAKAIERVARSVAPRVLWKTTTRMRKAGSTKWLRTDLLPRRVFPEIFDAARLTHALADRDYWDARHFQAHVYNKLNAALLRQLYGPPQQCDEFSHGKCARSKTPTAASAPAEWERAAVVADAKPERGWAGVATHAPTAWSALQTILWLDAQDITYDPKEVATRAINGSALLSLLLDRPGARRAAELGINPSLARRTLLPKLTSLLERRNTWVHGQERLP